jgi:16S rRNA (cytosine1402-N4)-methyltransferase
MSEKHIPVLLHEAIDGLAIRPTGVYCDATLGMGGHSLEIARRLTTGRLICIDRDGFAIETAQKRLFEYADKLTFVRSNFSEIEPALSDIGITKLSGVLFDFGLSSPQLDNPSRGFSYMADFPLDMRMDDREKMTARQAVNTLSYDELKRILREYGEERYAVQIARAIVRRREDKPIETTFELNDIIRSAMPGKALREKQNPLRRTYQSLRVFVNDEIESIRRGVDGALNMLEPGGRICCISFQSKEDVEIKTAFRARIDGCTCPKDFPVCVCGFTPTLKLISRKAITPTDDEIEINPRAHSAKLRIAERL